MKKQVLTLLAGMALGMALLSGGYAAANTVLTARPTAQAFYVNGQQVKFEAYAIHGNNFVKLRDIGQAVNFGVTYDAATNSVHIDPNAHYHEEVTPPAQTTPSPSSPTEEQVQTTLQALRVTYPSGTPYGAPYHSTSNGPYSGGMNCAGWATLCSDTAFGSLPWRMITNPSWDQLRVGDLVRYDNSLGGHVVVVVSKTDDYIKVTESGTHNNALWGGQYFKWWLEEQPAYTCYTRYPE